MSTNLPKKFWNFAKENKKSFEKWMEIMAKTFMCFAAVAKCWEEKLSEENKKLKKKEEIKK